MQTKNRFNGNNIQQEFHEYVQHAEKRQQPRRLYNYKGIIPAGAVTAPACVKDSKDPAQYELNNVCKPMFLFWIKLTCLETTMVPIIKTTDNTNCITTNPLRNQIAPWLSFVVPFKTLTGLKDER